MVEVVPGMNEPTFEKVKERFLSIAPFTDWVEIDVSDRRFTKTETWNNPEELKGLRPANNVKIGVHLMVHGPERVVAGWIRGGAQRIIVQYEGISGFSWWPGKARKIRAMAEECRKAGVEFGLSITTETLIDEIKPYLPTLDIVQVLAVTPGPAGQNAKPIALSMISQLRALKGRFKIEWDGGVRITNIRDIKNAGANVIVAVSSVFGTTEPDKALEALRREALN